MEGLNGTDVVIFTVATLGALLLRSMARAWALSRNRAPVGKSKRNRG